jgi:hypothetical protein
MSGATKRSNSDGRAFAKLWRIRMKPYFDALYGPDEWATDPELAHVAKEAA